MSDVFHFVFVDNKVRKTLALLHGTGGDENDLLPLLSDVKDSYNFLGIRGNVVQQGMNRFFKRNSNGSFDEESIQTEGEKLALFLQEHPADAFVGYSNGANMILAMALLYPDLVKKAVLLHPKLPFVPTDIDLTGKKFLVSYGERDRMITMAETKEAIKTLQELGAIVSVVFHDGGHEIHRNEIEAMNDFLG